MRVEKISDSLWQELISTVNSASAFHDVNIINCFSDFFNVSHQLYKVSTTFSDYVVPVYTRASHISREDFLTSFIGYGGPIKLSDDNQMIAEIQIVVDCLSEEMGKKFQGGVVYSPKASEGDGVDYTYVVEAGVAKDFAFQNLLSGNVRTAIRKADKSGVYIKEAESEEELRAGSRLINLTQRQVGSSYETPHELIKLMHCKANVPAKMFISCWNGHITGAAIILMGKYECFHWLHGWDREYAKLCGNQLLIWYMLKEGIAFGSQRLNLGYSHNDDIAVAKLKWGAKAVPVTNLKNLII